MTHFDIFCGHLDYFFRFGTFCREKSGNPDSDLLAGLGSIFTTLPTNPFLQKFHEIS
jgi:hypothetical protein